MYKVLLADDEPLVLVGLQSMLKWEDYNMTICGCARNGNQALEMIETQKPDIVIADIKMPCKTGLEVAQICRETYGDTPQFIILTSFEELEYLREAIRFSVVAYLVKVELTAEMLASAVTKAAVIISAKQPAQLADTAEPKEAQTIQYFSDKFFIRLLNNLFENRQQFSAQKKELKITTPPDTRFAVCYCEILGTNTDTMDTQQLLKLYSSTIRMVKESADKYCKNYVVSLDMRHFAVIFVIEVQNIPHSMESIRTVIEHTSAIVKNYFSVTLLCAVGSVVNDLFIVSESFNVARLNFRKATAENPLIVPEPNAAADTSSIFDISKYKKELSSAFYEMDSAALESVIDAVATRLHSSSQQYVPAMDTACTLLYTAISFLPDGEDAIAAIFQDEPDGFRCIYRLHTCTEIIEWIQKFGSGVSSLLASQRQNYKNKVILNVQKYIKENLGTKLSLNTVADVFCFSPNYLSQLFTKAAGCTFVEYITSERIEKAKQLLLQNDAKVYEIAESLGFESAFYFSKVFKKVTGVSPREFVQKPQ